MQFVGTESPLWRRGYPWFVRPRDGRTMIYPDHSDPFGDNSRCPCTCRTSDVFGYWPLDPIAPGIGLRFLIATHSPQPPRVLDCYSPPEPLDTLRVGLVQVFQDMEDSVRLKKVHVLEAGILRPRFLFLIAKHSGPLSDSGFYPAHIC